MIIDAKHPLVCHLNSAGAFKAVIALSQLQQASIEHAPAS
jgi:hypothetical protein